MSQSLSQKIKASVLLSGLCLISTKAICATTMNNSSWSGFYIGSQLNYINASTRWIYPEDTYYTLSTGNKQFSPDLQGATLGINLVLNMISLALIQDISRYNQRQTGNRQPG